MTQRLAELLQKLHKIKTDEIAALAEINAALDECAKFEDVVEANRDKDALISLVDYKVPDEEVERLIGDKSIPRTELALKMQELNAIRFNARKFRAKCSELDSDLSILIKLLGLELKARKIPHK